MTTATIEAEGLVKLRFLTHYAGRATEEDHYVSGQVGEFSAQAAAALLDEGVVELAPPDAPVDEPAHPSRERRQRQEAERAAQRPQVQPAPAPEIAVPDGHVRVRFAIDYRGRLTAEDFYNAGQVGAFDPDTAAALVRAGVAELAAPDARVQPPAERAPRVEPDEWKPSPEVQRQATIDRVLAKLEAWLDAQAGQVQP